MSLLSKFIRSAVRTAAPAITAAAAGFAGGGLAGRLGGAMSTSMPGSSFLPVLGGIGGTVIRSLPGAGGAIARGAGRVLRAGGGIGGAVAGGAAAGAAGQVLVDQFGRPVMRRRRRGRGFSARDIRQTRRMLKLIKEMQSAVPRKRC